MALYLFFSMCYSNSSTSSTQQLAERYNKKAGSISDVKIYHGNGFQFPKFRVITKEDEIKLFQWGLIPHWFNGDVKSIAVKTLNARVETISEKSSFKHLLNKKHCIIPSSGFFEWQTIGKDKIPYFIKPKNDLVFSMLGLYDEYIDRKTGEILNTYTIITRESNELMSSIHNVKKRMPLIISKEFESEWLDGKTESAFNYELPSSEMEAYTVRKNLILQNINDPETQNVYIKDTYSQSSLF